MALVLSEPAGEFNERSRGNTFTAETPRTQKRRRDGAETEQSVGLRVTSGISAVK